MTAVVSQPMPPERPADHDRAATGSPVALEGATMSGAQRKTRPSPSLATGETSASKGLR